MTNISGAVVWSATYDAFGKATIDASSTITNNLRFPGQYFDSETGLHYNFKRFYDSNIGRYVTEDPIGFKGSDYNLFVYVKNNPVNKIDYTGCYQGYCADYGTCEAICTIATIIGCGIVCSPGIVAGGLPGIICGVECGVIISWLGCKAICQANACPPEPKCPPK